MSKSKVKMAPVFRFLASKINSAKFYLTEAEPGKRVILKNVGAGVVMHVCHQAVVDALLTHLSNAEYGTDCDLTPSQADQCVKYWMSVTDPIPEPKYLGEKDDPSFCFQRLSFNYADEAKPTPVLDELMSRCTNSAAIMQFIGSLTVEDSSRFQYVWIFGSGGEGKGSFGRGLTRVFGSGVATMTVPRTDGQKQFLAYSLQGKRLCVFPECSNFAFPNDPLFKQLTGQDHVWLEQKGKMGFSGAINCKFIFFSNERAGVQGTDANTRRLIYSEISKPTVKYSASTYDGLVGAEMPDFIIKCRKLYLEKCPLNEDIQFDDEKTKELLDFNEEHFEVMTEKWLEIDAKSNATPIQMREIKDREKLSNSDYRRWFEYLRAKFGVESKSDRWVKGSNRTSRRWVGIRAKPISYSIPL